MGKKKDLKPGEKVILFLPSRDPCIGWVCQEIFGKSIFNEDGKIIVKVTCHEKEAEDGKGRFVSATHVRKYSDSLWGACIEWDNRRNRVDDDLSKLKKGKIPEGYFQERGF